MRLLRFCLLSFAVVAGLSLTGCDATGPDVPSSVASIEEEPCDLTDIDCSPGGGGSGGGTPGGVQMGTCPADWQHNYRIRASGQDFYQAVELDDLLIGDSPLPSVNGKGFEARVVSSNDAYLSGVGRSPRANAMTQVQVKCGSSWWTADEDDFDHVRVQARIRFINDVPTYYYEWYNLVYRATWFDVEDETRTSDDFSSPDLHVKEGGDRLDTSVVLSSVHSVSFDHGATFEVTSDYATDEYPNIASCPDRIRYFMVHRQHYTGVDRHVPFCQK